jgi:RimJ/RimL family protein N-acetyltransferase
MAYVGVEKEIILADGARCFLRDVREGDEAELFRLEEATTVDALLQGEDPDLPALPLEERAQWIQAVHAGSAWIALVAEIDGRIVGMLEFRATDLPALTRHVGRFFISLEQAARGRGIGRAMMELMLDWATVNPRIEKVSLSVLSENNRAIALYESLGFKEEGRRSKEFKLPGGGYADDVLMARWVSLPEHS